ncbi:hypothetical protein D3C76_1475270 [compost metagenome]
MHPGRRRCLTRNVRDHAVHRPPSRIAHHILSGDTAVGECHSHGDIFSANRFAVIIDQGCGHNNRRFTISGRTVTGDL